MDISDFDYELPENLIAQRPLPCRDSSRMLIVNRQSETWTDSKFSALPEHLCQPDVLVLNNTRVFPARLKCKRIPSGGTIELLLLRKVEANVWEALVDERRSDGRRPREANATEDRWPTTLLGRRGRNAVSVAPAVAAFAVAEWLALTGSGSFAGLLSFLGV